MGPNPALIPVRTADNDEHLIALWLHAKQLTPQRVRTARTSRPFDGSHPCRCTQVRLVDVQAF